MKNFKKQFAFMMLFALVLAAENVKGQNSAAVTPAMKTVDAPDMAKLRAAVEANPNDFDTHWAYIKAMKFDSPDLIKQYDAWIKKYPRSVMFPYSIGEALTRKENPNAKQYLLKALEIDPKFHKAYFSLWSDGERWGDFKASNAYLLKAKELDPKNVDYTFYYAMSFDDSDPEMYKKLILEIAQNFPSSPRAAQALYWLAYKSKDPAVKIEVYELLRKKFNSEKSVWTSISMSDYYDFLLESDAAKAHKHAIDILAIDSLEGRSDWEKRRDIAHAVIKGRELMNSKKYREALAELEKVSPLRRSSSEKVLTLEKAKATYLSGEKGLGYEILVRKYAEQPSDDIMKTIREYAAQLGKNEKTIRQEIETLRKIRSEPATAFSLDNYLSAGKTSLKDLKGKVVLVTYWFPGCGPCRGEFPHFENVVRKFGKDQLAYVGINIVHEQDPYVVPFVKNSGYSFVPVRDEPEKRGNLTARGAPTNYLLDKEGNIIFKNFMIHGDNERMLELMISELLDK